MNNIGHIHCRHTAVVDVVAYRYPYIVWLQKTFRGNSKLNAQLKEYINSSITMANIQNKWSRSINYAHNSLPNGKISCKYFHMKICY